MGYGKHFWVESSLGNTENIARKSAEKTSGLKALGSKVSFRNAECKQRNHTMVTLSKRINNADISKLATPLLSKCTPFIWYIDKNAYKGRIDSKEP